MKRSSIKVLCKGLSILWRYVRPAVVLLPEVERGRVRGGVALKAGRSANLAANALLSHPNRRRNCFFFKKKRYSN